MLQKVDNMEDGTYVDNNVYVVNGYSLITR